MGDPAHQARKSDHNYGNAIDLTHDPLNGFSAHALAEALRRQMSTTPLGRITYIISDRRIASSIGRWQWRRYGGPNPHVLHCHISIRPSARGDLRRWKLT